MAADVPGGTIRSFNPNATERLAFTPFPDLPVSARVAAKDLDGDGRADVVAGAGRRVTAYAGAALAGGAAPELFALDAFPGVNGAVFVG